MEDAFQYLLYAISAKTEPGQTITSDLLKEICLEAQERKEKHDRASGGY